MKGDRRRTVTTDGTLHDALGTEPANSITTPLLIDFGMYRRTASVVRAGEVRLAHFVGTPSGYVIARRGDFVVEMENGDRLVYSAAGFKAAFERCGPR